jgi:hypothetical protein
LITFWVNYSNYSFVVQFKVAEIMEIISENDFILSFFIQF